MSISNWLYNRIISSTAINAIINGNCFPDNVPSTAIPGISYTYLSQSNNLICRQPIITIRSVETTQDKCELLNELLYNLFDNTTTRIQSMTTDGYRIENCEVIKNIPCIYDFNNFIYNGILDIRIYYER